MNAAEGYENIIHDTWLAKMLGRKTCKIVVDDHFIEHDGQKMIEGLQSEEVFLYSKVPVSSSAGSMFLQESGFRLIDTNVVFEKSVSQERAFKGNVTVRFAEADDETQVAELAGRGFRFSRFHRDGNFSEEMANKIKAGWARNFFKGKRGEYMVVADSDDGIKGFLQLLREGTRTLVIDLVAVNEGSRHKGIASDMITFAEQKCVGTKQIKVGTQLANVPSMRMYEKLGFREMERYHVFHYHSPEMRKR